MNLLNTLYRDSFLGCQQFQGFWENLRSRLKGQDWVIGQCTAKTWCGANFEANTSCSYLFRWFQESDQHRTRSENREGWPGIPTSIFSERPGAVAWTHQKKNHSCKFDTSLTFLEKLCKLFIWICMLDTLHL